VYHLTRYKYVFFAISLAVIVPGVLALIFWGLNLGIDFTQGTTVQLRFANKGMTSDQLTSYFKSSGAQDVSVYLSTDPKGSIPVGQYAYLTFSRPVDRDLQAEVLTRLQKLDPAGSTNKGAQLIKAYSTVTYPGAKESTALMVVAFDKAIKTDDIQKAMEKLPDTTIPPLNTEATPTPTAASGTPSATASATGTAAPTATAQPTATATPAPTNAQKFPVSLTKVQLGANDQTYLVNTQTALPADRLNQLVFGLDKQYGPTYVQSVDTVGPSIAADTTRSAFIAVAVASLVIMCYIAFAFRKVGSWRQSFRYGASAIIALLHDSLVVLGLWAIFGHFFGFKVDSLFLTAILTVIGFSVHDTIVVFDRIRENMSRRTSESFETIVDTSLVQTLNRSLNTSLTVLFTLAALTLFGGESIREFTLALLIGIASGTFSSIFNASMILTVWETGEYKRWFGRGRQAAVSTGSRGRSRELVGTRR
jgi:preprotein translocase SecF subunit